MWTLVILALSASLAGVVFMCGGGGPRDPAPWPPPP